MKPSVRKDLSTVHRHITEIMPQIIHPAAGWLKHRWIGVSWGPPYDRVQFSWDGFHQCLRLLHDGDADSFKDLISNHLQYQAGNGWMPLAIHETAGFGTSAKSTFMPFLAQGVLLYLENSGDTAWPKAAYRQICNYLQFWEQERGVDGDLYCWWFDSGYDNDVVHTFRTPRSLASVSVSALIYLETRALCRIAARTGHAGDARRYATKAERIRKAINDRLWNEEYGMYADIDLRTGRHIIGLGLGGLPGEAGRYAFLAWHPVLALYARLAPPERARRYLKNWFLKPEHFWSPYGIRSLSARSEYYNNAVWGNPARYSDETNMTASNWQGPVWFPVGYFTAHALRHYGLATAANELADRLLHTLAEVIRRDGCMYENYSAEDGRGLYAPKFMSWNMLADQLHAELATGSSPLFQALDL